MNLTLNRDFTLSTAFGHSIAFVKDVPTHVPAVVYQAALAIGAVPSTGGPPEVHPEAPKPVDSIDPDERAAAIMAAIHKLVARNGRDDFTAAGSPAVDAVHHIVEFRPTAKEIGVVWAAYNEEKAGGK